jgi:hypothetical protein
MKRHQIDPWSLIGGVVLTGLGLLFLIPAEPFDLTNGLQNLFGWALPVLVVVIGLALLAPALRRRDQEEDQEELPEAPDPFERI